MKFFKKLLAYIFFLSSFSYVIAAIASLITSERNSEDIASIVVLLIIAVIFFFIGKLFYRKTKTFKGTDGEKQSLNAVPEGEKAEFKVDRKIKIKDFPQGNFLSSEKKSHILISDQTKEICIKIDGKSTSPYQLNLSNHFAVRKKNLLVLTDKSNRKSMFCYVKNADDVKINIDDFYFDEQYVSSNEEHFLGIDKSQKQLIVNGLIYKAEGILSIEIIKNESEKVGGFMVSRGGLGIGDIGTKKKLEKLDLMFKFKNLEKPIDYVNFYSDKERDSLSVFFTGEEEFLENIRHWSALIGILIEQVKMSDVDTRKANEGNENGLSQNTKPNTLADEIKKLAELKNKGILTEEEFQLQKTRLLQ